LRTSWIKHIGLLNLNLLASNLAQGGSPLPPISQKNNNSWKISLFIAKFLFAPGLSVDCPSYGWFSEDNRKNNSKFLQHSFVEDSDLFPAFQKFAFHFADVSEKAKQDNTQRIRNGMLQDLANYVYWIHSFLLASCCKSGMTIVIYPHKKSWRQILVVREVIGVSANSKRKTLLCITGLFSTKSICESAHGFTQQMKRKKFQYKKKVNSKFNTSQCWAADNHFTRSFSLSVQQLKWTQTLLLGWHFLSRIKFVCKQLLSIETLPSISRQQSVSRISHGQS